MAKTVVKTNHNIFEMIKYVAIETVSAIKALGSSSDEETVEITSPELLESFKRIKNIEDKNSGVRIKKSSNGSKLSREMINEREKENYNPPSLKSRQEEKKDKNKDIDRERD